MKVSACGSRGVALVALTRSKRLASIWRSSGVMSLSHTDLDGRARHMDITCGQSKTAPRRFSSGRRRRGAALLRPADRLPPFGKSPRLQFILAVAGVLRV